MHLFDEYDYQLQPEIIFNKSPLFAQVSNVCFFHA